MKFAARVKVTGPSATTPVTVRSSSGEAAVRYAPAPRSKYPIEIAGMVRFPGALGITT